MTSTYPKDEFDLAADDMPVGMHRPEPSRWKNVIPFLVILVAVPVLAWALSQFLTSNTDADQSAGANTVATGPQSAPGAPAPQEPQSEPQSASTGEEPAPAEQPQSEPPTQAAAVNFNVVVEVLNGTGVQGLAGEKADALKAAGFQGVTAANADGWVNQISTVYYQDPQVEGSAKEIARILGIETVSVEPQLGGNADIVVVLK